MACYLSFSWSEHGDTARRNMSWNHELGNAIMIDFEDASWQSKWRPLHQTSVRWWRIQKGSTYLVVPTFPLSAVPCSSHPPPPHHPRRAPCCQQSTAAHSLTFDWHNNLISFHELQFVPLLQFVYMIPLSEQFSFYASIPWISFDVNMVFLSI